MNKAEKELKELKAKIKSIRASMYQPLQDLANDKATNPTDETNEKYNILLDGLYDLIV